MRQYTIGRAAFWSYDVVVDDYSRSSRSAVEGFYRDLTFVACL